MTTNRNASQSWVIRLIIINGVIYFLQTLTGHYIVQYNIGGEFQNTTSIMTAYAGLIPAFVITKGYVWQVVSYMFLHGSFTHILFNMYALLIFGTHIEQAWGSKKFLIYYFFTGVGAGVTILVINIFAGGVGYYVPTIGASGAVFGLLLAFGLLFPDAVILLFFFIPIRAKYLVVLYGALEFYLLWSSGGQSTISHVGHIGGLVFGIIYFLFDRRRRVEFKSKIRRAQWNARAKTNEVVPRREKASREELEDILRRVKENGSNAITDDEFQKVRYLQILNSDMKELCVEEDFNQTDRFCQNCEHYEACLVRAISNYLK